MRYRRMCGIIPPLCLQRILEGEPVITQRNTAVRPRCTVAFFTRLNCTGLPSARKCKIFYIDISLRGFLHHFESYVNSLLHIVYIAEHEEQKQTKEEERTRVVAAFADNITILLNPVVVI